jgi:hypothetical protein
MNEQIVTPVSVVRAELAGQAAPPTASQSNRGTNFFRRFQDDFRSGKRRTHVLAILGLAGVLGFAIGLSGQGQRNNWGSADNGETMPYTGNAEPFSATRGPVSAGTDYDGLQTANLAMALDNSRAHMQQWGIAAKACRDRAQIISDANTFRTRVQANTVDKFIQNIRGVQTYSTPAGPVDVPNWCSDTWFNGSRYCPGNGGYNPNQHSNLTWQHMPLVQ